MLHLPQAYSTKVNLGCLAYLASIVALFSERDTEVVVKSAKTVSQLRRSCKSSKRRDIH
jgi:hypothetical protein